MKKLLSVFIFCISFCTLAQEIRRENISGNIIIESDDIEGITIANISSGLGTVTDANGEFEIAVALNDFLEIRSLKYENIDIRINEIILQSKKLSIFLIEEINKLDEIVVTSKRLTGNLSIDFDKAKKYTTKGNSIYFGLNNLRKNTAREANINANEDINVALPQGTLVDGLNIVNVVDQLLIPLFRSELKDKKGAKIPTVPAKSIRYYFGSDFLNQNFNIPKYRVEEFIRYVEDDSFDLDLLNYGREIEFLELLTVKSKSFLKKNKKK